MQTTSDVVKCEKLRDSESRSFSKHSRRKQNSRMSEYIVVHSVKVAKDFTTETFGRLTTVGPVFLLKVGRKRRKFQVCVCDCGCEGVLIRVSHLQSKAIRSCGCLRKENSVEQGKKNAKHGMTKTPTFIAWMGMKARCYSVHYPGYKCYGGRGISVHPDWDNSENGFQNFYDYMGPKPTPEHSIDRYPNKDGNYEPGNVRWATPKEQQRNKRNNRMLTYNGKTQCLAAWAEETGINRSAIVARLQLGWSLEAALTTPTAARRKRKCD